MRSFEPAFGAFTEAFFFGARFAFGFAAFAGSAAVEVVSSSVGICVYLYIEAVQRGLIFAVRLRFVGYGCQLFGFLEFNYGDVGEYGLNGGVELLSDEFWWEIFDARKMVDFGGEGVGKSDW